MTSRVKTFLIFLQGGGARVGVSSALAVTTAPAGIPDAGVLDQTLPENPFADFDVVYVFPIATARSFAGLGTTSTTMAI
ncbi:MAG: hypothetical protein H6721_04825 [Sandaracinus sp.]|nr:hypothetical protein [Sandaracinus sp.]